MNMNNLQLKVILGGAAIALAAILYPPWKYTFQNTGISQVTKPAGYEFLFTPPSPERTNYRYGVEIDYGRLGIELLGVSLLTVSVIGIARLKKREHA